eukprot:scaffold30430_cov44-Prasinocladus_malaysianus.AAC.1
MLRTHPDVWVGERFEHMIDCGPRAVHPERCPASEEGYIAKLESTSSRLLEEASRNHAKSSGSLPQAHPAVAIRPSDAAIFVRAQEKLQAEMRAWTAGFATHIELQYEDLAVHTQQELARVFTAMSLDEANLDS